MRLYRTRLDSCPAHALYMKDLQCSRQQSIHDLIWQYMQVSTKVGIWNSVNWMWLSNLLQTVVQKLYQNGSISIYICFKDHVFKEIQNCPAWLPHQIDVTVWWTMASKFWKNLSHDSAVRQLRIIFLTYAGLTGINIMIYIPMCLHLIQICHF